MSAKSVPENRVREVRKQQGLTMEELADRVGKYLKKTVHFTTIAKIERSMRGLSGEMLSAIADSLGVPPAQLVDQAPQLIPVRMLPIVGKIAAGNWREAIAEPLGYLPAPVGGANAFALKPEGTSMNLVVGDNALIVVDPDELDLLEGKLYAVMNGDGETTFKRYRNDPPRLEPVSSDPSHAIIPLGREPFTVIGRIIWQGSAL